MGSEVLEEMEFCRCSTRASAASAASVRRCSAPTAGGDGEWMRSWEKDCGDAGLNLVCESVTCCDAPDDAALEACRELSAGRWRSREAAMDSARKRLRRKLPVLMLTAAVLPSCHRRIG